MNNYLLRRVIVTIPTIVGITMLIFLVMRILPGDPVSVVFGQESFVTMSKADQERFRSDLGLDKPLYAQYLDWMGAIATGDLGRSFWRNDTVADLLARRGPITAQIAIMAVVFSWVVGIPIGIMSATRRGTWQDHVVRVLATLFLAIPSFWLGVAVVLVGILYFSWRPPLEISYLWTDPWKNLQLTTGPALALGVGAGAYVARITRSSILELLHADFVRTARAKGAIERQVIWRHVFINAVLPVLTLSGLILAGLLGGSVAVETAFGVPGLGTALVRALADRDYMVVQNLVLVYAVIFAVVNLAVDLAYGWLDPRIRYD
ncbi:MAG: ABC transporter permease [Chloroflexi bacterium]|nr:ABC transporter permease [Chloroflexota bacterium]